MDCTDFTDYCRPRNAGQSPARAAASGPVSVHDAFVLQACRAEVEQQPALQSRRLQIINQLRHVAVVNGINGFHFDENFLETDQVDFVIERKGPGLVQNR